MINNKINENDEQAKKKQILIEIEQINEEIKIENLRLENNEKRIIRLKDDIEELDNKNTNDVKEIEKKIFFNLPLYPNVKQILFVNNKNQIFPKQYKNIYHTFYLRNNIFNDNKYEEYKIKSIDSYFSKFSQSSNKGNYLIMYLKKNAIDYKNCLKNIISSLQIKKKIDIKDISGNDTSNKQIQKKYGFYIDINKTDIISKKTSIFKIIVLDLGFPNLKEIIKDIKDKDNLDLKHNCKERADKNKNRINNKKLDFSILSGLTPKKTLIIYEVEDGELDENNFKKLANIQ
jgi:LAS superfamily LD-carboxypeptidase LdcB